MDSGEHVWCGCGAQWHGYGVTVSQSIIADHKARSVNHQGGCADLTHAAFLRVWRCTCSQCAVERMVRRKLRR